MKRNVLILLTLVILAGLGSGLLLKSRADSARAAAAEAARVAAEQTRVEPASTMTSPPTTQAEKLYPVTYNGTSFSPRNVQMKAGATVVFSSESQKMWIASSKHPDHALFDGTTLSTHCDPEYKGPRPFDQCAEGVQYEYTFEKRGTFEYHDHLNPGAGGTVTVL